MRKLIRKMPQMAFLMLDKCLMVVGTKETAVHKNMFAYEFLEDQFAVGQWQRGKSWICKPMFRVLLQFILFSDSSEDVKHSELYTSSTVDLVMNHPLFLMAKHEAHDLMSHPLCDHLVKLKFKKIRTCTLCATTLAIHYLSRIIHHNRATYTSPGNLL